MLILPAFCAARSCHLPVLANEAYVELSDCFRENPCFLNKMDRFTGITSLLPSFLNADVIPGAGEAISDEKPISYGWPNGNIEKSRLPGAITGV